MALTRKGPALAKYFNQTVTIAGIVIDDPVIKDENYRIRLQVDAAEVYVILDGISGISRSDQLTLRGLVQTGFGSYAACMYRPTAIAINHPNTPDLALRVRAQLADNIKTRLHSDEGSGLVLSYLFGQKTLLSEEQSGYLRLAGLAHIVVASGYHLSVIVNFAKKRFGKISRLALLLASTALVMVYVSVTGSSPSMIRAAIVTISTLIAWYFGRRLHPVRSILYAAAISLLFNSSYIANLAWQLSFASYSGILLLSPLLASFLYGKRRPSYIASIIIASTSAQIFCLPLSILYFGKIPILALASNLIISPLIPLTMLCGLLVSIVDFWPFAMILRVIIDFQLFAINAIAKIPWANFEVSISPATALAIYVVILLAIIIFKKVMKYSYRPAYSVEKTPDYDKIYAC